MNIFLTGDINIGKTTIIQKFLETYSGSIGGFRTVRIHTDEDEFFGVYLLDVKNKDESFLKKNKAGDCFPDKSLISYEEVFETLGVEILSFETYPSLIIMDELGKLESNAIKFQKKVHECLNSHTNVLGIIKNKHSSFLDSVRNRDDVTVLSVTQENRDLMTSKITELLL